MINKAMKTSFNKSNKLNHHKIENLYKNKINKSISIKRTSKLNKNNNLFILNRIHLRKVKSNKKHKALKRISNKIKRKNLKSKTTSISPIKKYYRKSNNY